MNVMSDITPSRFRQISPQLLVADIEKAMAFYTRELGFTLDFRYEDFYAVVSKDGYTIHLKSGEPCAEEREQKLHNEHLDMVCSVDNIEALYHEYTGRAIMITQSLRTMPYGKEFYIADPDGYIIAFVESV
jgi:predicted enzyme related to lactoylglutathione lyase